SMDTGGQAQRAVVDALGKPTAYPESPATVERIDTHSAHIFLAGSRAYKLKRALRYPFLDYSTLERRQHACEAELRLNRRTAPTLYERTARVTREAAGSFAVD